MDKQTIIATATIVGEAVQERPSIPLLLPPEVILGGDWTEKVDIWTVGCLVCVPILPVFVLRIKDLTFVCIFASPGL